MFYAAQVRRASARFLRGLGADAERWAAKLEKEDEAVREGGDNERTGMKKKVGTQGSESVERLVSGQTPRIVEIS